MRITYCLRFCLAFHCRDYSKLWINPGFGGSFDGDNADFCLPSLLLHEALRFKQTKQRVDPKVLKRTQWLKITQKVSFCNFIFRELPTWERVYCWILIVVGFLGGAAATYISLQNIVSSNFQMPCYLQSGNVTIDASH